jgi:hypothetical protein
VWDVHPAGFFWIGHPYGWPPGYAGAALALSLTQKQTEKILPETVVWENNESGKICYIVANIERKTYKIIKHLFFYTFLEGRVNKGLNTVKREENTICRYVSRSDTPGKWLIPISQP